MGSFFSGAFSLIILSALVFSGSLDNINLVNNPSSDNAKLVINDKPLYGDFCATLEPLNDTELSNNSDMVVIGTVKEILPSKWNSADGKRPNNTDSFNLESLIYTDITINVDKFFKSSSSSREVTVRVYGGTVGNDTLVVDFEPTFQPGEKVLLYLMKDATKGTSNIGPEHFKVTGLMQGKFTLTDDGKAVRFDKTIGQDELLSKIKE